MPSPLPPRYLAVFFRALELGHVLAQHAPGYSRQLLSPLREVEQERVGSRLLQLHKPELYFRNRLWGEDRVEFATSHGYQFNPYLYVGVGAGAHYYFDAEVVEIPVFAHVRSEFLKGSVSPFVDFKAGYTVYDETGFYMTPSVGCRFAIGKRSGISIGLGYTMQRVEYDDDYYSDSFNCGGFSIKVSLDF